MDDYRSRWPVEAESTSLYSSEDFDPSANAAMKMNSVPVGSLLSLTWRFSVDSGLPVATAGKLNRSGSKGDSHALLELFLDGKSISKSGGELRTAKNCT